MKQQVTHARVCGMLNSDIFRWHTLCPASIWKVLHLILKGNLALVQHPNIGQGVDLCLAPTESTSKALLLLPRELNLAMQQVTAVPMTDLQDGDYRVHKPCT